MLQTPYMLEADKDLVIGVFNLLEGEKVSLWVVGPYREKAGVFEIELDDDAIQVALDNPRVAYFTVFEAEQVRQKLEGPRHELPEKQRRFISDRGRGLGSRPVWQAQANRIGRFPAYRPASASRSWR